MAKLSANVYRFFLLTIGFQLNWAYLHGFHSIIQRIFICAIGSLVLTAALAWVILFYQGHLKFHTGYQYRISDFWKNYRLLLIILGIILVSVTIIISIQVTNKNILLNASLALFFCWLIIVSVANRIRIKVAWNTIEIKNAVEALIQNPTLYFSTF
jgi:hypothetical protein